MKQSTFQGAFEQFKEIIANEFERHPELYNHSALTERKFKKIQAIMDDMADDSVYFTSLKLLSDCLCTIYQKHVIVLIDEYDVPLENVYFNGFYPEMLNLIRSVFESVLKTNESLEFTVLTGCLRISKESIFTGLNNLKVYSVSDIAFSQYFGFTDQCSQWDDRIFSFDEVMAKNSAFCNEENGYFMRFSNSFGLKTS